MQFQFAHRWSDDFSILIFIMWQLSRGRAAPPLNKRSELSCLCDKISIYAQCVRYAATNVCSLLWWCIALWFKWTISNDKWWTYPRRSNNMNMKMAETPQHMHALNEFVPLCDCACACAAAATSRRRRLITITILIWTKHTIMIRRHDMGATECEREGEGDTLYTSVPAPVGKNSKTTST